MATLHIFNPEHEYAMANHTPYYMAPRAIKFLASRLELLPMIVAEEEDFILLTDGGVADAATGRERFQLENVLEKIDEILPWGWNRMLRHNLEMRGIPQRLLPSFTYMDEIRRLSHRRITINCNNFLKSKFVPREFYNKEEALDFAKEKPGCYFKLPWSSGGRGVLATEELNLTQIAEWISGGIRSQGSVIGEAGVRKTLEFASLWLIKENKVKFEGFSVSISDGRGKYKGNLYGDQEDLINIIKEKAFSSNLEKLVDTQKSFIRKEIMNHYNGRLGIDVLVDDKGVVYGCSEINFRCTMGHIALMYNNIPSLRKKCIDVNNYPLKALCTVL